MRLHNIRRGQLVMIVLPCGAIQVHLGILVNNGAVTYTRCLSTKRAPTVRDLLRMIFVFQDGPGQRGPLSLS